MTTVYFVRHAQPNFANHDDLTRELTAKGMADRHLVEGLLAGVSVDAVLSSPYRRAVDTVHSWDTKLPALMVVTESLWPRTA